MDILKLRDQLVRHESLKKKPYTDTVGKLTIGIGHNLSDKGLTTEQINIIFKDDVNDVVDLLNEKLPWWDQLDDVRQRVLLDMTFNLMSKILDFKEMLIAIQTQNWEKAANEILRSKFAAQTGQRAKALAYMMKTGKDPQ